jgi:hypothetical protein
MLITAAGSRYTQKCQYSDRIILCVFTFFFLSTWILALLPPQYVVAKNIYYCFYLKTIFLYQIPHLRIEFCCTHYFFIGSMKMLTIFHSNLWGRVVNIMTNYFQAAFTSHQTNWRTCLTRASNIICPWNISSQSRHSKFAKSSTAQFNLSVLPSYFLNVPHSSMSKKCLLYFFTRTLLLE